MKCNNHCQVDGGGSLVIFSHKGVSLLKNSLFFFTMNVVHLTTRAFFMEHAFKKHTGEKIVVDTNSAWLYIGTLKTVDERWIELEEVDVHDSSETTTSKELYVLESKASGIKANRSLVYINVDFIVSFSPLDDVKYY